jgi:AraC-like DNA-binding protein
MLYRTYRPAPALAPYIDCFWILRSESNPFVGPEPLIPDGSIELIFNLGAPYERFVPAKPAEKVFVKGSHMVGERTEPFLVEQLGAIDHVAVRFKPGGLYPFMRAPVSELTNQIVDAELILDLEPRELEERLFEARSDVARIDLLEKVLLSRLRGPDAREILARTATQLLAGTNGSISMGELCAYLDCDYKQLERTFLSVVGVRPKFFARLTRFVAVVDALKAASSQSWTRIALDFGYYDHAHFTREFKAFTAFPPSQFGVRPDSITGMLARSRDAGPRVSNSYKTAAPELVRLAGSPHDERG